MSSWSDGASKERAEVENAGVPIARKYIDAETRTQLEKILDLKSKLTATDARIESINKEVKEIGEDQSRLRDNIKALIDDETT